MVDKVCMMQLARRLPLDRSQASGGNKFSKSDIKKIYFGNWLRDYSQVNGARQDRLMTYAFPQGHGHCRPAQITTRSSFNSITFDTGLKKLSADSIVLVISVLGFMVRDSFYRFATI